MQCSRTVIRVVVGYEREVPRKEKKNAQAIRYRSTHAYRMQSTARKKRIETFAGRSFLDRVL